MWDCFFRYCGNVFGRRFADRNIYMKNQKVKTLITAEDIEKRVVELAERISADYAGREILLVGILKGGWMFMSDLARKITAPLVCDFLWVGSYGAGTKSSGEVKIVSDVSISVEGRDVLIVEDIADTGLTVQYIKDLIGRRGPRSLKVCALLDKPGRRKVDVVIDYIGFAIEEKFVVGYGTDYNEKFRSLPYIGYLEEEQNSDRR